MFDHTQFKLSMGRFYIMKLFEKSLLCGLIFSILLSIVGFSGQCENISKKVFRLHIIANSDSVEDQELKLKVRDRILSQTQDLFNIADSKYDAKKITEENLNKIIQIAQDEVYANGYNYPVCAKVTNMHFNTRRYDNFVLPAGRYDALRIEIGKSEGKNWWCVMFPPLCVSTAQENKKLEDVLSKDEFEITNNETEYELKFKIIEWFEKIKDFFCTN